MAQASGRTPQRRPARLTARRLDALARKKAVDRHPVDAEDATDTNGVQAAVVDQAADRLGMDTELAGDLPDGEEIVGLVVD